MKFRLVWASLASLALMGLSACLGSMGPFGAHFGVFLVTYALFAIAALFLFFALPARYPSGKLALWIFGLAIICRLLIFPHSVDSDVFRYLWEGKLVGLGVNPYVIPPNDPQLSGLRDIFWGRINHPSAAAAYPPGILLFFSLMARLHDDPFCFKAAFVLFDLATLGVIWKLLCLRKIDPRWSLAYALNPVALISFAGQGHFDSIMIFFMMAALLAFHQGRWLLMFALLALGAQSKLMALLLLPFVVHRSNLRHAWVFIIVILWPCLPFVTGGLSSFTSFLTFATAMAHNGPFHHLLRLLLGSVTSATVICTALFLVAYGAMLRRKIEPIQAGWLAFAALLLFSPTVHFWYVAWLVPFFCFHPSWAGLLLCCTSGFYFSAERQFFLSGEWEQPFLFYLIQWAPVLPALACELIRAKKLKWIGRVDSISAVIPTLNEAGRIGPCIESLKRMSKPPIEVVVVDGGSNDQTVHWAKKYGAKVYHAAVGRGSQLHRGLLEARGDVVLFVHADSVLAPETGKRIMEALNGDPSLVGGAVGQAFDAPGFSHALIEILNEMKTLLFGISFGDQVQFVRTSVAQKNALVPEIPLMEDVELSLRMRRIGKTCYLWGGATVSSRKWQGNFMPRLLKIISLLGLFFLRRLRGKLQTEDLYQNYYCSLRGE